MTRRADERIAMRDELASGWWIGLDEEAEAWAAWHERRVARDAREQRLQAAGFDPVSAEQRAANLAVTLMYL